MIRKKILLLGLLCLNLIVLAGCARTVTLKSDAGSELDMLVRFNGPTATSQLSYYIIFPKSGYDISSLAPINKNQEPYPWFDAPKDSTNLYLFNDQLSQIFNLGLIGTQPVPDFINYYFSNYYTNWYDYLEIKGTEVLLHKGPFYPTGNIDTNDNVSPVGSIEKLGTSVLTISLPMGYLSHVYAKGDPIYFFIMTVKDYQLVDWEPRISFIANQANSNLLESDDADSQNNEQMSAAWSPGADILSWDVYVR